MNIEITIPVLNEAQTLETQVNTLLRYIKENKVELGSIVVVISDNGSTDGTEEIAKELVNANANVRYIRMHERGVGLALKTSWIKSDAEIVGYMDLDLATDLRHLKCALLPLLNCNADIVTGSRLASGAKVIGRTKLRSFTSIVLNKIIQMVFGASFTDGMCGFKFLRREILESLIRSGANSNGWFFATELLVVAEHRKYRVMDLPVVWTDDSNSKVKIVKLSIEYILSIRRLKKNITYNKFS